MPDGDPTAGAPPAPPPAGAVPPMPMQGAATPPGPTGPGTVAPNKMASRLRGMVMANLGLDMLDKAIGLLGSSSEEGAALLKAMTALSKMFGTARSKDLSTAELKLMGARQAPMGQPMAMPGAGARDRLASLGMGGGGAPTPPAPGGGV